MDEILLQFGANTIKTFDELSDPGVQLQENDIYFIDIGPVWDNDEGDAGNTFVTGNDPEMKRCSEDVRQIFETVAHRWRTEGCNGEVTQIAPLSAFYAAEDYHQEYVERHPHNFYITAVELPKLDRFQKRFPELYKPRVVKT